MAAPDFIEIGSDDPKATTAFFTAVMDWTWEDGEGGGGYFTDGTRKVGMHQEGTPCMVPYLAVDNIEVAVARVKSAGGALMGEIAEAPGFGRFATCTDPRGVRFGLHEK
ncbi:VOC family protein [Sulfitobacter sp. HNIBRBA3233]|uniref:VOC family protein n=1 Tax=Sulfitobacter marinivivus TaxID=3158558 RepID=UPI0032DF46A7